MSDNVRQQRRRRRVGFRTTVRQRVTPENESAGKHRSGKIRKGNRWLRGALIQAALAGGTRATKGAFAARYRRVMRHRCHKKAVAAVAQAMLVAAYYPPAGHNPHQGQGADY